MTPDQLNELEKNVRYAREIDYSVTTGTHEILDLISMIREMGVALESVAAADRGPVTSFSRFIAELSKEEIMATVITDTIIARECLSKVFGDEK